MNTPTKFLLTAVLTLGLAVSAQAATLTWTGDGDGVSWNDAGNWGGSTPTSGDTLVFTNAANGQTLNNDTAADNTYIINFASGADDITFSGNRVTALQNAWFTTANTNSFGSHTVNFDVVMANPGGGVTSFRPMTPNTFTVNGLLSGASGLQTVGNGNLLVTNANNSFDGFISVMQGATMSFHSIGNVGQNSALGTGSSDASIRLGSGPTSGTLNFDGSTDSTTNRVIQQTGSAVNRINANGTSGARLVFTGDNDGFFNQQHLTTTGTRTLALGGASTANNEISGVIRNWSSNAGGHTEITKADDGKWVFTGANTYTGLTSVNGGILEVSNSLTTGELRVVGATATLLLTGDNTGSTSTLEAHRGTLEFTSLDALGGATNRIRLGQAADTATLRYSGSDNITIDRGIRIGNGIQEQHVGSAIIEATGAGQLVFSAATLLEEQGAVTAARTLTLRGTNALNNEIQGTIADHNTADGGTIGIIKDGTGHWILSGNNTYTGATTINAGTLVAAHNNAFGAGTTTISGNTNTGTLALQGGITLAGPAVQFQGRNDDYQASTGGIRNLSGNNTITVVGAGGGENYAFTSEQDTLTVNYSTPIGAADRTYIFDGAGDITFNGNMGAHTVPGHGVSIYKVGTGTTTLTGNNPITGEVQVNAGGLIVNNIAGSGTGTGLVTVASGARIGGSGTIGGDLTLLAGARFVFDPLTTLNVTGDVTLDDTFGVASLVNADGSAIDWGLISDGIYTIVGTTTSTFNNISNFGDTAAFDIGGGRSAYFQNGSLELVVVPEPATYALIGGLLALGAVLIRRRMK